MLESGHESKFFDYVEEDGGVALKIKQVRGYPDRIVVTRTGYVYWLETKQPEGALRKFQKHIHKVLRGLKQDVRTAYTYQEAIEQYEEICSTQVPAQSD